MSFRADLSHDIGLVTGASSGLGRHFAGVLAAAGAHVVLLARRRNLLEQRAQEIAAEGGRASAVACDVTDEASVAAALAEVAAVVGCPTILVNNAGAVTSKPLLSHTGDDWDRVLDVNLKGAWLVSRAVAELMIARDRPGRIINIASILGIRPIVQVPSYAAAKAGLLHLTRAMALELAPSRITVNAIAPGYVETDLNRAFLASPRGREMTGRIPLGRLGRPEDIDGALLLLASSAGAYITGTMIAVDGGHLVAGL